MIDARKRLPDHLVTSLVAMIAGEGDCTWHVWWLRHAAEVESHLSRTDYLKLKFGRLEAAAEMLARERVHFNWTPAGRRLSAWAKLHVDAVDSEGRPKPEIRRRMYGGAFAAFEAGDAERGDRLMARVVQKIAKEPDAGRLLGELLLDAENFGDEGHVEAAQRIAGRVASLPLEDADGRAALNHAKAILEKFGGRRG